MHILLTGGGTAGHVLPNIAIAGVIKESSPKTKLTYMGSYHGIEKKLCEEAGISFESIATGKLRRYFDLRNILDFFLIPIGILQALFKLKRLQPQVIFSKGGYVAVPVVLAAWLQRVPIFLHESDAIPGLATRLCVPFAKKIFLGFEEAGEKLKSAIPKEVVGNPIRINLDKGSLAAGKKWTNFTGKKPVLLVMGGSSGSKELNEKIELEKKQIVEHFDVIHITGEGKGEKIKQKGYLAVPYVNNEMKDLYALASLALTRAGAGALAELEALQIPALLFPLGLNASRGDQIANAAALIKRSKLYHLFQKEQALLPQLLALPPRAARHTKNSATQKIAHALLSASS